MNAENRVKNHKKFQPPPLPLLYLPNWILVLAVVKTVRQLEYNHSEDFGIIQWLPQSFLKTGPREMPLIRLVYLPLHKP